jgi:hypothetical protein
MVEECTGQGRAMPFRILGIVQSVIRAVPLSVRVASPRRQF